MGSQFENHCATLQQKSNSFVKDFVHRRQQTDFSAVFTAACFVKATIYGF